MRFVRENFTSIRLKLGNRNTQPNSDHLGRCVQFYLAYTNQKIQLDDTTADVGFTWQTSTWTNVF